ncbi:integrin alpha-M-like [Engraulis encrasicolus]|uniref:integrin alpha-M-like n=1 Tax=Engraulis encrasicolus TaxID=184585 RepID=UPI002FD66D85
MPALVLALTIATACHAVLGANIESTGWKVFSERADGFGHRVIQRDPSSVLVSAPLQQYEVDRRGQIYECLIDSESCSAVQIQGTAVNMSLGLSMTKAEKSNVEKTWVCGPTIPKECPKVTQYGGMCVGLNSNLQQEGHLPLSLEECRDQTGADILFLLDGSGSVWSSQFSRMKRFVKDLIRKLQDYDTEFSIAQYSSDCTIHIKFNQFDRTGWEQQVDGITQKEDLTKTASAILTVVNSGYVAAAGVRPDAKKILIVITDGVSVGDKRSYDEAIGPANRKNITRFAIGVGNAFNSASAKWELETIASAPVNKHMFKVDSFEALDEISSTLETSIIAIEGGQTTGDATIMEFAQNGFSAAVVSSPKERLLVGVVGANQWRGGYQDIHVSTGTSTFNRMGDVSPDSYLGYSMAVAVRHGQSYIVMGAPRYEHKGLLMVISPDGTRNNFTQSQSLIGAYFGAEVCVVDLDGDSNTDLILVSAPMHIEEEREGRVLIYRFEEYPTTRVEPVTGGTLLGLEGERGRFGWALASLADLNGDEIRDVAVGAPLEDDGRGSLYIFNGRTGGINPTYSQRIVGSSVRSGLRFFGWTVAPSALDQSGDGLPDIAVGSKGAVLLLRSRPLVSIATDVSFQPSIIPTSVSQCAGVENITASVCFNMAKVTSDTFTALQAKINYSLSLDVTLSTIRAFFNTTSEGEEKIHTESTEVTVSLGDNCFDHPFYVQCRTVDVVNPIVVEVALLFHGLPIEGTSLKPQLDSSSATTTNHNLNFEIDCGEDGVCVDNIHLNFNFSGLSTIEVGIAENMIVVVTVENRGEDSYSTRVSLSYPPGLSYRTVTKKQGRVDCTSLDSTHGASLGKTDCRINTPILKAGHKATFEVQYGIGGNRDFGERVTIQAQAFSDNENHTDGSHLIKTKDIAAKYSIYVIMTRFEGTTSYINFTAGNYHLQKPVTHNLEVTNGLRDLNLTVVIRVPVRLQDKDLWTNTSNLKIDGCTAGQELRPAITDLQEIFKNTKEPTLNCSIAVCLEFRCASYMPKRSQNHYSISGNVSSAWIEQTGLRSALFRLVTSATLEFDNNTYIFYSSDSSRQPPVIRIQTNVELYEVPDLIKEIIGGVVGGLVILILLTVGLTKFGFFKSSYQKKLKEAGAAGQGGGPSPAATQ